MKTKHFDSYIYKQDKKFEAAIVIICAFLIGFMLGYACIDYAVNNENNVIESEAKQ